MEEKKHSIDISDGDTRLGGSEGDTKLDVSVGLDASDGGNQPQSEEPSGGLKDFIRIFQYADSMSWILNTVASVAAIGSGVTLPLMTVIFGNSISSFNNFSVGGDGRQEFENKIYQYVLYFVYLFIGKLFLTYISTLCISIAAIRTTRAVRQAFLEQILRQEIWRFDKQGQGAIAIQVTTNGNRINQGIADKLAIFIQSLTMFLAAFVVALAIQWKLTLITMTCIPAIFLFVSVTIVLDARIESRVMKIYSRAGVLAEETFSSIRTIHAFWAHRKMANKYDELLQEAHVEGKKKSPIYGVLFSAQFFCVYSAIALAFWQGYRMYSSGEVSDVGKVFSVVFSMLIATNAISAIAPQFPTFTNAAGAASELFAVLDKPSLLDPLSDKGEQPSRCNGQIEVRDLNFEYPARPGVAVLKGLNLSIPAGKTTALVGASGCGKSTLVGLLERWYEPVSGTIELDGLDIARHNTKWLRSRMRLVQQEPVLFRGTVFQNVANGFLDTQLDLTAEQRMELVQEACKASNAHEFIKKLPRGYETEVGERAGMLSGGQRQRIAIARSIISNPSILLLDEATSALDPKAEKVVQAALDKISENRTTLVIAHKLSTVKNADSIAVISDGVIAEQGTHDKLLEHNGLYAKLVAAQDLFEKQATAGGESDGRDFNAKEGDDKPLFLRRETSAVKYESTAALEATDESVETLNYSLLRCIYIMLKEQKPLYISQLISAIVCLICAGTFPAQAILFSRILQVFTLHGAEGQHQANFWALMFFVVALANFFSYFIMGVICNHIGQFVTHAYRHEMFVNILKQDMDFFDLPQNTSGALTSKISSLPTALQDLISANLLLIFIIVINIVASSILALAYGWKLALVVIFGGLPPLLLSGYTRIRLETNLDNKTSDRFAESASLASEAVSAIKTVSSLTLESSIINEYSNILGSLVQRSIPSLFWTLFWYALSQAIEFLIMALGFWYGSQLLSRGEYTIDQFYVIFVGVLFAGQAAAQFFGYTTSITKATTAANYILWLRTLRPAIREDSFNAHSQPEGDVGNVTLADLSFKYTQRPLLVLKDLSISIESGQFAAFVGPSGCGKSTMISLLERFYDPTSGSINFANKPLSSYSPRLYRQAVSLVQQEPTLYSGSVRENIALALEEDDPNGISDELILSACHQANASDFIQSLPQSLSTPCGGRGLQFSGGQKQRIAIARALIRKPKLLLLDEATSALDTNSERIVQRALDQAKEGRTTIAVAHRLSTVKHADVIFVFGAGRVVEMGTHVELLARRGNYYDMCMVQGLDQAVG